ncbi:MULTISPECIES: recombinase family protein [unclassified Mesorhizobium]|uniref:recombinase family protein n=1 Tax=unclassified Mesorhizobium TaxID=325217 RepID=UPI000FCA8690|nr:MULTISPECIES: recombinase family protein [unclassified Mesorhizobium]RUU60373.1 recombinase family protein [Mesorhizobium sp. M7A.T.Ca.TU.009.01.1.1]RUU86325.1 recombinase family protein [Mesorhizobium sp. M7A.T.Ca.TU.009.01.1.2]RUT87468.1 recombinase family protein [Mesorhizobium sp. M7A.T.Ca.US.000.02.1.1]RUT90867.1 recombinase family protein [Mesorhizobium sp. M7A.T.Ca.US.000.02.2.1]RUT99901.1 recombinase family protein [Mesorhizobium sp. M7A.T.Ca.TU.009.02.1.1]
MVLIGYARVSTRGQDYETQVLRLRAQGAEKIFSEKKSGLDGKRPELARCIEYAREGDTLLITKLDRLARSTADLYRIVSELTDKGVAFKVLDDNLVDTTTRTGKLVMGILALIAEFETDIRKERQMEGIAKAKAEGRVGGRPRLITPVVEAQIGELRGAGFSIRKIATEVGLSKASVQKVLEKIPG